MNDAEFEALMRRPLRDVITDNGGSSVDRGHMVDHTHDAEADDFARSEGVIVAFLRWRNGFLVIAAGCAVMAVISYFVKG